MVALATQFLGRIPVGDRTGNVRRRGGGNYLPPETPGGHQKHQRSSLFFELENFLPSGVFGVRTGVSGGRLRGCSPHRRTAVPPVGSDGSLSIHGRRVVDRAPSSLLVLLAVVRFRASRIPWQTSIRHNGARSHDLRPPGAGQRDVIRASRRPTILL